VGKSEKMSEENLICFNFVINLRDNQDPEAWDRILDTFIEAVEKEGGGAGGGVHQTGANPLCEVCREEGEITMLDLREIGTYIQEEHPSCRFVGISDEDEVFLEFTELTPEQEEKVFKSLKKQFPEISSVITVVKPSLKQLQEMVDNLNDLIENSEKTEPQKPLLDLERF
jgi:hypothetical protein